MPLVHLGIYVPRLELDPPAQAGLGALTVRSAVRGAGDLDAAGLAFAFERLGGTPGPDRGVRLARLRHHRAGGAPGARRPRCWTWCTPSPRLEERDVARERGLMIAEAQQVADDMFRYPFQLAFAAAFGEEGYGLPVAGLPDTLPAITAADTRAWHLRALRGVRPVVIAVGDVDPDEASAVAGGRVRRRRAAGAGRRAARARLGGRRRTARRRRASSPATRRRRRIAMAFPGVARRHRDRAAAQVWAAVASGLGGRLFEALRDRRSLAYTVVASAWLKARAGALVTYIATSPEREDEAREEMLRELERFTREPVSASELRQAVNYLAGPGGGEPPVRQRGGGRDPRGVGGRLRARGARGSRGGVPGGHRRGRAAGGADLARSRAAGRGGGPRTASDPSAGRGAAVLAVPPSPVSGEPAADHLHAPPDIHRGAGDHRHEAEPLVGNRVEHDVALAAEQGHGDTARTLAHERRSERRHPDRAGGRHDDGGQAVGVRETGRR